MARHVFRLPDVGEGIAESEIAEWKVKVGDVVQEDQPLVDMLTEKAAVEIPSPVAGKVVELHGAAGDKIAVGAALVVFEVEGAGRVEAAPVPDRAAVPAAVTPVAAAAPTPVVSQAAPSKPPSALPRAPGTKVLASPSVRQRARDLGVHLNYVTGSGPAERISHEDLDAFMAGASGRPSIPQSERSNEVEQVKIIGVRRKIAEAMQRSKQRIPHFAFVEEVDVTELEALRTHLNDTRKAEQPKLTLLPFLMRALVKAIPEFPQVNATYDDEQCVLTRHRALHIGIATQTPNGLLVPVVRHAGRLDAWQSAAEVQRLAAAARAGKATREELSGSTITITSLGALGGIASTPIINAPEVAIIGINKMVERPVVRDGQITVRRLMNISSSFDHRIVDGWDAASFIQRIKALLEHPATLYMH